MRLLPELLRSKKRKLLKYIYIKDASNKEASFLLPFKGSNVDNSTKIVVNLNGLLSKENKTNEIRKHKRKQEFTIKYSSNHQRHC